MRTIGSTAQFTDSDVPLKLRCISLFRDILSEIYNSLLDHIIKTPSDFQDSSFEALSKLSLILTEPKKEIIPEKTNVKILNKNGSDFSENFGIDLQKGFNIGFKHKEQKESVQETKSEYRFLVDDKVIFPELSELLNEVLQKGNIFLYILLDEWSSVPKDLQPYLAEFLKRSFLPNPRVIIKIAALEYRSYFSSYDKNQNLIGFELGADISADLDIDDYYVVDRNPHQITESFSDMIYKHLKSELPDDYFELKLKINSGNKLVGKLFTNKNVFHELVRASEGIVRDLIQIFSKAFFDSLRMGRKDIEKKSVLEAARAWFEQDKAKSISEEQQKILSRISNEVIGNKKARSFLIPRELENNPNIQQLFDLRLIHIMKRGYADKINPGTRYNIYSLDYGTYVDLLNTSREPEIELIKRNDNSIADDFVVPFDDKRSIRRIILSKEILAGA